MVKKRYVIKYKQKYAPGISKLLKKIHSKKKVQLSKKVVKKRKVSIPLTSKALRKYGRLMTIADLRRL